MQRPLVRSMMIAVVTLVLAGPLRAQARAVVSSAELDAAISTRPASSRQAIQTLLATDQAKEVAGKMGLDAAALSSRVAVLDQATLDQVVANSEIDTQALAGGSDTIVISATTVIIVLLLLILLVK